MMRVLKYMYLTIKILLLPVVIALLIYFRADIFQPHISQYADDAQSFIEKKYDISIPVHVTKKSENEIQTNQLTENKNNYSADSPIDLSLDKKSSVDKFPSLSGNSVDGLSVDLATEAVKSVAVRPEVVEQEIVIIFNNNSEKLTNDNLADVIDQHTAESAVEPVIVGAVAEITDSPTGQVIDEVVPKTKYEIIDSKNNNIDPALMEKLSETVDIINRKVDMLFAIDALNKDTNNSDVNSADIAIIKQQKIKQDLTGSSAVTSYQISAADAREMLLVARQTFWNGNPVDSEKIYLDLLKLQVDNADVYGELGNVYYSQGKWQQAGKAYYEAALRLLDLNQTQQVDYLLRLIQGLDAESAEKLKLKISG